MVSRIVWSDIIAPRGLEIAMGSKELEIYTIESICNENIIGKQQS